MSSSEHTRSGLLCLIVALVPGCAGDDDGDGTHTAPPGTASSAEGIFLSSRRHEVGFGSPGAMVLCDIDGDGAVDAIVGLRKPSGSPTDGCIAIAMGDPNGGFAAATVLADSVQTSGLACADLDGDGRTDLVATDDVFGEALVFLGRGDGSFAAARPFSVGDAPRALAIVDLDGDGALDLVTGNATSSDVSVLLGNGDGTFDFAVSHPAGLSVRHMVVGNVDAGNVPDVIVLGFSTGALLRGVGDGSLAAPETAPAGNAANGVVLGDVTEDGIADLVIASQNSHDVVVHEGVGDGSFVRAFSLPVTSPTTPAIGDLDDDGVPDIVLAERPRALVLLGTGQGAFELTEFVLGASAAALVVADADGDGIPDLVASSFEGDGISFFFTSLFTLIGRGDGSFESPCVVDGGSSLEDFVIADFDLDRILDVAIANRQSSAVSLLLGNGDGTFATRTSFPGVASTSSIAAVDVNQDLLVDLVVGSDAFGPAQLGVLTSRGDGTFDPFVALAAGVSGLVAVTGGDADGDQIVDLIVAGATSHKIALHLGVGDGTFETPRTFGVGERPTDVVTADFNFDGREDVATANALSGDVAVLLGRGDGSYFPDVRYPVGDGAQGLAVGDLNQDLAADLVTTFQVDFPFPSSGGFAVLLGRGDGTFAEAVLRELTDSVNLPTAAALGDLDGDGLHDLVIAASTRVLVALGRGDGTFGEATRIPVGAFVTSVLLEDVDADGALDLLAATSGSPDRLLVFLNQTATKQSVP